VGDREILETYFNSESKNTSATDIFPHEIKSMLTSVTVAVVKCMSHCVGFLDFIYTPHYVSGDE